MENWRIIAEFEAYEVSDKGNVRRIKNKNILKRTATKAGYYVYMQRAKVNKSLTKSKVSGRAVSVLVARAFLPNPNNYRFVGFKDKDQYNPVLNNLEYFSDVRQASVRRGTYVRKSNKLEQDDEFMAKMRKLDKADLETRNYFKTKKL